MKSKVQQHLNENAGIILFIALMVVIVLNLIVGSD